jgi:ABC-2 type transport system ATP-binding protein
MAQRLMIARALMHAPNVLFLDEPTNNLDPQSRLFLWERIRNLNAEGLTILLTTHDMDEADKLCHRIAIMDHGKILVNDTPAELKKLIPGGSVLELRAYAPEAEGAAVGAHLVAALRAMPGVTKVDEVGADAPPPPAGPGKGPGGGWPGGGPPAGMVPAGPAPPEPGILAYRVYADSANTLIGQAAQAVVSAGAEVRDVSVKHPTLEEVFIFLTGRHLR